MTTTPDFEAKAREIADKLVDASDEPWVVTISSALLRAFELGCQAGHSAGCTDGVAAGAALQSGSSAGAFRAKLVACACEHFTGVDFESCSDRDKYSAEEAVTAVLITLAQEADLSREAREMIASVGVAGTGWELSDIFPQQPRCPIEEAGTADEVSAANTSASLTPHQEEA